MVHLCPLEGGWRGEMQLLTCERVGELQELGMEVEAVGEVTVEAVAEDRGAKTFGSRRMDAKLVGATRLRAEAYAGDFHAVALLIPQNFELRNRLFAMLEVHPLPRQVVEVGAEREGNNPHRSLR